MNIINSFRNPKLIFFSIIFLLIVFIIYQATSDHKSRNRNRTNDHSGRDDQYTHNLDQGR